MVCSKLKKRLNMKRLLIITAILQLILLVGCKTKELTPEQLAQAQEYSKMIEAPDFIFVPNNAQPMSGKTVNLTPDYSLKVTKDTIEAYLPYFGRAYTAPSNPSEGGIKFISTNFDYDSVLKKNGTYEIKITPKDLRKPEQSGTVLYLSTSNSGYGSLRVQMTNKQAISYYGRIEPKK